MLRVVGGTCPATNPTPLSVHETGGVEARTPQPSGVLATRRQPEGMSQPLPAVTAATLRTIGLQLRTLIARGRLIMKASQALGSLGFRLIGPVTRALTASLCEH
ncbi:hypothetical protein FOHLNKBM_4664 [Methylobacterium longum]|nr:hypothetical protein FOHLNKBM_4664 [Methylobacterium longum]